MNDDQTGRRSGGRLDPQPLRIDGDERMRPLSGCSDPERFGSDGNESAERIGNRPHHSPHSLISQS